MSKMPLWAYLSRHNQDPFPPVGGWGVGQQRETPLIASVLMKYSSQAPVSEKPVLLLPF